MQQRVDDHCHRTITVTKCNQCSKNYVSTFFSLDDIVDDGISKIDIYDLPKRQLDWSKRYHANIVVGNCVLNVSNHVIVKRSYWMSINFDNISDNEDKTNFENDDGSYWMSID